MDAFIIIAMSAGLFVSGISLGAYLENKRLYSVKLVKEINDTLKETQQILLPLGDKITHLDIRQRQFINHTIVDYSNTRDPEITLDIPKIEEEAWLKNQRSWED